MLINVISPKESGARDVISSKLKLAKVADKKEESKADATVIVLTPKNHTEYANDPDKWIKEQKDNKRIIVRLVVDDEKKFEKSYLAVMDEKLLKFHKDGGMFFTNIKNLCLYLDAKTEKEKPKEVKKADK